MSVETQSPGIVRRLYDWVLHWADTPYGIPALAALSFAESSFFPIPPDVLLIALVLGAPSRWFRIAAVCSVASVVGGICGYGIGIGLWHVVQGFFFDHIPGFTPDVFAHVRDLYEQWNFKLVFVAGFTPLPYKVITITAGVAEINFPIFVLASALSRSARFFLVAALLRRFGEPIRSFIDRYFNILSIVFVVLLLGGFVLLKQIAH